MKKSIYIIIGLITAFVLVCLISVVYLNSLYNFKVKQLFNTNQPLKSKEIKTSPRSESQKVAFTFENTLTGTEHEDLKVLIASTPIDSLVLGGNIEIRLHKANERGYSRVWAGDDSYKQYTLSLENGKSAEYKGIMSYCDMDKAYSMYVTPSDVRQCYQKIIDLGILKLENPVPSSWFNFSYVTSVDRTVEGVPYINLNPIDYTAIGVEGLYVWDSNEKNKKGINDFLDWFETSFKTRLLQNPVNDLDELILKLYE